MIVLCSKCNINWASLLKIQHEEIDEVHEVCPLCRSNSHITDANSLDAYIYHPMTGAVVNVDTDEPYVTPATVLPERLSRYETVKRENERDRKKKYMQGGRKWHPEIQKSIDAKKRF